MTLSSLKYDDKKLVDETRQGVFIYGGDASRFHEWEFRTLLEISSCKKNDLPSKISEIVKALRGEASTIAMDIGVTELLEEGGVQKLITAMNQFVFTNVRAEAKELYKIGHNKKGMLSRQSGEPMFSYISRRRRWWTKLNKLDPDCKLSETIRGDLMLDASGLTQDQQNLVLTSISNSREFERVAAGLLEQHGDLHVKEKKSGFGKGFAGKAAGKGKSYPKRKGKGKGKSKNWKRQGNLHQGQDEEEEDYDDDWEDDESVDDTFYQGFLAGQNSLNQAPWNDYSWDQTQESNPSEEWATDIRQEYFGDESWYDNQEEMSLVETKEEAEIDTFTCLLGQQYDEVTIASMCQLEATAFAAWNHKGKSKGKSKYSRPSYSKGMRPQLSLEERKKALKELKQKTKCNTCGEVGHWTGDAECKKKKGLMARYYSRSCNHDHEKEQPEPAEESLPSPTDKALVRGATDRGKGFAKKEVAPDSDIQQATNAPTVSFYVGDVEEETPERECEEAETAYLGLDEDVLVLQDGPYSESETSESAQPEEREKSPFALSDKDAKSRQDGESDDDEFGTAMMNQASSSSNPEPHQEFTVIPDPPTPYPRPEDKKMMYGEHKGKKYSEILQNFPEYLIQVEKVVAKNPDKCAKYMRDFVSWAQDWKATNRLPGRTRRNSVPEKKPESCPEGCTRFTTQGSNQHWTVYTCLECGHSSREEVTLIASQSFEECKHLNTDHRGSTKSTMITFCKDCVNVIDVRSREEAAKGEKIADKLRIASSSQQNMIARTLDEQELNLKEVETMFELFKVEAQTSLKDRETVTSTELVSMLEDAIDATKGYQRRALMHTTRIVAMPVCNFCEKADDRSLIQPIEGGPYYHKSCHAEHLLAEHIKCETAKRAEVAEGKHDEEILKMREQYRKQVTGPQYMPIRQETLQVLKDKHQHQEKTSEPQKVDKTKIEVDETTPESSNDETEDFVPICEACGHEVELDDGLNEFGKSWIQTRDGNYLHSSCWAAHPNLWEGDIDQSELDSLCYEPGENDPNYHPVAEDSYSEPQQTQGEEKAESQAKSGYGQSSSSSSSSTPLPEKKVDEEEKVASAEEKPIYGLNESGKAWLVAHDKKCVEEMTKKDRIDSLKSRLVAAEIAKPTAPIPPDSLLAEHMRMSEAKAKARPPQTEEIADDDSEGPPEMVSSSSSETLVNGQRIKKNVHRIPVPETSSEEYSSEDSVEETTKETLERIARYERMKIALLEKRKQLREARSSGSDPKDNSRRAMMVRMPKNKPAGKILPEIDIFRDPGIWVCMDEGCNSNCHGEEWAKNAIAKFKKINLFENGRQMSCEWVHQRSKCYEGIGNAKVITKGKRIMPACLRLCESKLLLPTMLESHEQEGSHPLLLSDESQGALGMVKDMREGVVYLKDYDDFLPLYRAKGSGLKVICISNFPSKEKKCDPMIYVPDMRDFKEKYEEKYGQKKKALEPLPTLVAHPASSSDSVPEPKGSITLVSFGLENYWRGKPLKLFPGTTKHNKWYSTVKEILEYHNWRCGDIEITDEESQVLFRHFIERHPEKEDHLMHMVNCLKMSDPDHDKSLRDHTGLHPETLSDVAAKLTDEELKKLAEKLDIWYQDQACLNELPAADHLKNLIIMEICKKERHRSVAGKFLTLESLRRIFPTITVIDPYKTIFNDKYMCTGWAERCDKCTHNSEADRATVEASVRLYTERLIEALNSVQDDITYSSDGKHKLIKQPPPWRKNRGVSPEPEKKTIEIKDSPEPERKLVLKPKSKQPPQKLVLKEKKEVEQRKTLELKERQDEPATASTDRSEKQGMASTEFEKLDEFIKSKCDPEQQRFLDKEEQLWETHEEERKHQKSSASSSSSHNPSVDASMSTYNWPEEEGLIDATLAVEVHETEIVNILKFLRQLFNDKSEETYNSKQECLAEIKRIARSHLITADHLVSIAVTMAESRKDAETPMKTKSHKRTRSAARPKPPEGSPEREERAVQQRQSSRPRDPRIRKKVEDTEKTGVWLDDFDPTKLPGSDLLQLFTDREELARQKKLAGGPRQFITYMNAPGEEKYMQEYKVMVKCKYDPKTTAISVPNGMEGYAKTTIARITDLEKWVVLEDRAWPTAEYAYEDWDDKYDRMCIFLQKPRYTREGHAYLSRAVLDETELDRVGTMNKKQREIANEGISVMNDQDEYIRKSLKATSNIRRSFLGRFAKVLCVLPCILSGNSIGAASQQVSCPAEYRDAVSSIDRIDPDLIIGYEDLHCEPQATYCDRLSKAAKSGKTVLHFAHCDADEQRLDEVSWYHGRGNIKFACNDEYLSGQILDWTDGESKFDPPISIKDMEDETMVQQMIEFMEKGYNEQNVSIAFPAETHEEEKLERENEPMDAIESKEDEGIAEDLHVTEHELLEEVPLPGMPKDEAERKKRWLKLPRPARVAIRRLHNQFGHKSKEALIEILKASKSPEEYIAAARDFRCNECERNLKLPKQTNKVSMPPTYKFNHRVGVDINYITDAAGETFMMMNMVDIGTSYQIEAVLRIGHGTPSSLQCLDTFMQNWVSWAGYPDELVSDRGLNNRGIFVKELSAAGVYCGSIGLEAPYQLGKVERHGDIWKKIAGKVIETRSITGLTAMTRLAQELNAVVNEMNRSGGFSPVQWVLGRRPRNSAGEQGDDEQFHMLEGLQERVDPTTIFAERMAIRHEAKKAFIRIDSSQRVSKALLRKAAPKVTDFQVGDLISFQREQGSGGDRRKRWSPAARIIGFERGGKVVWAICEGVPYCLAHDKIIARSDAQALAYKFLHEEEDRLPPDQQQSFIDLRRVNQEAENMERALGEKGIDANLMEVPQAQNLPEKPEEPSAENIEIEDDQESNSTAHEEAEVEEMPTKKPKTSDTVDALRPTESRGRSSQRTESRATRNETGRSRSRPVATEQAQSNQLLETWNRTGTTGRGLGVLERNQSVTPGLLAFLAHDRLNIPMAANYSKNNEFQSKNDKKEIRGKTLSYDRENKETREGLDISRRTEWEKWKQFVAGRPCRGAELKQLLDEGHVPIPTRWVDTDRNAHQRRDGGPMITADYKSRLCGRGDLEGIDGLRKDSPTAEIESHNLLFSWAASCKLLLKTADISNAYFQSDSLDRLLLLRPPKGGIPDPEYEDGETMILARVPIYGTQDAGRKFWQRFKKVITENGFRENKIAKALYVIEVDGEIMAMLITHVDDLCWAAKPEFEKNMTQILETFIVKKVESGKFRFCGKEIEQLKDFSIKVTCKDSTEQIGLIKFGTVKRKMTELASDNEIAQMRSVVGSLGWIARQCRPDLSYDVSKGQSVVTKATLKDLKECNLAVDKARQNSDKGIIWSSDAVSWETAVVVTISDASFAQETVIESDGKEKPHRTQKAFMILLVDPDILSKDTAGCHVWAWRSLTDKRVCRATLQGEAHGMLSGTEMGDRLRAIIADCRGKLPEIREWQQVSSKIMRHLWLSDCESLVSHLKNPKTQRMENVRLSIDIQGLKQMLWEKSDGTNLDELLPEEVAENAVRWIDTSCMVVDCLTKRMRPDLMIKLMDTGKLCLKATPESQLLKLRKQKLRAQKRQIVDNDCQTANSFE